jgi:hypothetical protein
MTYSASFSALFTLAPVQLVNSEQQTTHIAALGNCTAAVSISLQQAFSQGGASPIRRNQMPPLLMAHTATASIPHAHSGVRFSSGGAFAVLVAVSWSAALSWAWPEVDSIL